ncbi:aspartic proteinase CDR1-like [Salvia divinorum]|uniref:Aspartic proteinase CDR1-like n=1 Tax=Salvia divinorum TaxID=28513 RepID=A0ABD1G380_SALDI
MPCYHKSMSTFLCSLLLYSLYLTLTYSAESSGGLTLDFFHRDSRHSPSYDPSITRFQRLRRAFDRSLSRKSSLAAALLSTSTKAFVGPIKPGQYEYLMKIKVGTPPVEQLAITDTGSRLTWFQCKPCYDCYNQTLPLFDPSRSSTYRPVPCGSHQCDAPLGSCGSNNTCQYRGYSGPETHSYGELATETLTFDGGVSFPNLTFGCGHENSGRLNDAASGVVGLAVAGDSLSIIKQLKSSIRGKFSYCLTLRDSNATSKISFGSSAVVAGPKVVSTPLLRKPTEVFYYLILEGFSVGGERLGGGAKAASKSGNEGNIIIESGTTVSIIPDEMYGRMEAAVKEAVKGERVEDPQKMFGLCYKKGGGFRSPAITAHFKNADVVLAQESLFVEVEKGIVCFTLLPSQGQDLAIFGNLHQMNYRIGFDLEKKQVSFLPTDCSNPQ